MDFNRDVKPILSETCFKCHGPDAATVMAGLRLDSFAGATAKRENGAAIVPGNPEASLAWRRISAKEDGLRMPPVHSDVKPLTAAQKETIRTWIAQGAMYTQHWAFRPPTKAAPPSVRDAAWVRNDVDRFVLASLEAASLRPEPEADRRTLIRRVSLTLTGLPPTQDEIKTYLEDRSAKAYEAMVDRYLASPRYGEHQARYWLDAVRYGDTHGLHLDNERSIYPYRDWVVRAFNQDLPFDRFTLWQLAGDLLPKPTTEQRIATGYVRMNPTTAEGGAIDAEFQAKNTFDRVDTTGTVFLGVTIGCAKCHDHKYDPFSQKDYYSLFAFFNSTADAPLDGNALLPGPVAKAPTPEQEAHMNRLTGEASAIEAGVDLATAEVWLMAQKPIPVELGKWEVAGPFEAKTFDEAFAQDFGPDPGGPEVKVERRPFELKTGVVVGNVVGKENAAAYLFGSVHAAAPRKLDVGLGSDDGVRVWVNGKLIHDQKVLRSPAVDQDRLTIELKAGNNDLLIKIVNSGGGDGVALTVGDPTSRRIADVAFALSFPSLRAKNLPELRRLFLELGPETTASSRYRALQAEIRALDAGIPQTLVAEEAPSPRPAFLLKRGQYDMPAQRVSRALPPALGTLSPYEAKNRLGLAQWLIRKDNPLVSRVFVNRIWQQHFGTGLVKTAEDFGNQGEWPSHPELLDTLAVRFIEDGWSVKDLHRLLLGSASFRQAATVSKAKLAKDPENRLISRGPRFRLDAEVLRDQALFVSGLLVEKPGGRGFRPYQPEGLWEAVAFADSNTARYVQDKGEGIYRRSLYLFWKRTSPHPTMLTFDAPMREACSVRRGRTNTPLQALVTLNEPAYFEAARALAERTIHAAPGDDARLAWAFERVTGRTPNAEERTLLLNALRRYRTRFAEAPSDAEGVLKVGDSPRDATIPAVEHAAWTLVCSTLMNTDEFLTQH